MRLPRDAEDKIRQQFGLPPKTGSGQPPKRSRSKYRNKLVKIDGVTFHSQKEANRWLDLQTLQKAGVISGLKRQQNFELVVNGEHITNYRCDFLYFEKGQQVVEDVKSPITAQLETYVIKKRLMKACHGISILET